jgi:hypothetical protein
LWQTIFSCIQCDPLQVVAELSKSPSSKPSVTPPATELPPTKCEMENGFPRVNIFKCDPPSGVCPSILIRTIRHIVPLLTISEYEIMLTSS